MDQPWCVWAVPYLANVMRTNKRPTKQSVQGASLVKYR